MERQPGRLYVAQKLNSKQMFVDELIAIYIDEYEIHLGKPLTEDERQAVFDAPQQHLHVFGFAEDAEQPGKYVLPEERQRQAETVDSETTIEALIILFLTEKEPEVVEKRWKQLRGCLTDFQQHVGSVEFKEVSEQTIKDYRTHILARTSAAYVSSTFTSPLSSRRSAKPISPSSTNRRAIRYTCDSEQPRTS